MPSPSLTPEQLQQAVDAVAEAGTVTGAARAINMNRATLEGRLREAKRLGFAPKTAPPLVMKGQSVLRDKEGNEVARWDKSKLAGRDDSEVTHVPDPKKITKVSTYYDQIGNVAAQWVTERPEDIAREKAWLAFAADLAKKVERVKPTKAPKKTSADLLAVYPIGDHHVGMLADSEETGDADYDLKAAERLLTAAAERLIETCPPCDQALIATLGDFFHYDSFAAVTPKRTIPIPKSISPSSISQFQSCPLAFRFALAPMTNDFVALLKDSWLASSIALLELTLAGQRVSSESFLPIPVLTNADDMKFR